ncbi:MAG: WYL domain-containing protein [Bacteroidales bacterium]|nr:WYL domain-containing protein [Bacteroidales bacterium]
MSQTKEAYIRYRIIDRMLVNRKEATLRDLQLKIEDSLGKSVSDRTIKRDLEAMRYDSELNFNAPIEYDRRDRVYFYGVKGYSINKLPLAEEEMNALFFARGILEQFSKSDILAGVEGRKETPHVFHPYLLKEYFNRWYVFGYEEYWNALRIYGLDRITEIKPEPGKKFKQPSVSPKEYFRNIIGVTRFEDTEPEKIRLKFSKQQAPYVLSQPIHESQLVEETTGDYTIISLNVHTSPELEILLLGWGSEVEVLEPEQLRKNIAGMHHEGWQLNQS